MRTEHPSIVSNPEILGGTLVFVGSRVPFSYLIEYLERGSTIGQFVEDYPSITSALAMKALEEASSFVDEAIHARPS